MSHTIRTRMAPSPTGEIHVGSMYILLKNYAFAKKHGGAFVLRIEDTDQEREVPGAIDQIKSVIRNYGLDWDEGPDKGGPFGPYVQSERLLIYQQYIQQLLESGHAYHCFCSPTRLEEMRAEQIARKDRPHYDGRCLALSKEEVATRLASNEPSVVRLVVPVGETISFTDLIRGEISFASDQVDHQVLLKSDGFPTYHFAVVVDDHLMQITHVMRGEEWITSTPKHILLYKAFGWEQPIYAHIPVFLNPDGKGKMSKRKGTVSAQSFLDRGYLPEALLNFFMLLGWAPADQREILTLDEYIAEFDPKDISAKSVVFDIHKLDWINGIYIRNLSQTELAARVTPFLPADFPKEKLLDLLPLISERLVTLADIEQLTAFFYRPVEAPVSDLLKKGTPELVQEQLSLTCQVLKELESWTTESIEAAVRKLQEEHDWQKKQYFMMLRVAATGQTATPPLFETLVMIGQQQLLDRFAAAAASTQD